MKNKQIKEKQMKFSVFTTIGVRVIEAKDFVDAASKVTEIVKPSEVFPDDPIEKIKGIVEVAE